jgi:apolipoprotein N-acyltransferase
MSIAPPRPGRKVGASSKSLDKARAANSGGKFAHTLLVTALGCALLWCAFPPLSWWPLAWLAPLPWLWLVARPEPITRREYWAVYLASFLYWAALLQGIRLAHEALIVGWLVLAAYVAIYLPLFIGASRALVHGVRWPLAVAAPVVWVALEYARAYVATGFSLAMLAQSQTPEPLLLQCCDLCGAYGLSALMMLTAVAAISWSNVCSRRERILATATAGILLAAALGYGAFRLNEPTAAGPSARVMLVQGSQDTKFDGDPDRPGNMIAEYNELTLAAVKKREPVDLVVWPESAFIYPNYQCDDESRLPAEFPADDYRLRQAQLAELRGAYAERMNAKAAGRTHFLAGGVSFRFAGNEPEILNSALWLDPQGKLAGCYSKKHLVVCGEYLPLGDWFPALYALTPIRGTTPGDRFESFDIAGLRFAPNICFESVVPQLFVRQHRELAGRGQEPDVLLNTTNDGWFYASSILDLHFQCAILRAVENRKPFLIAANTGISGVIDGNGRVLQRGPKRATEVLVADVRPDGRASSFHTVGDWPAAACLVAMLVGLVVARRRVKSSGAREATL